MVAFLSPFFLRAFIFKQTLFKGLNVLEAFSSKALFCIAFNSAHYVFWPIQNFIPSVLAPFEKTTSRRCRH